MAEPAPTICRAEIRPKQRCEREAAGTLDTVAGPLDLCWVHERRLFAKGCWVWPLDSDGDFVAFMTRHHVIRTAA